VTLSSAALAGNAASSASRIRHARLVDGLRPSPLDDVAIEVIDGLVASVATDPAAAFSGAAFEEADRR
jgi:hypothetical protein